MFKRAVLASAVVLSASAAMASPDYHRYDRSERMDDHFEKMVERLGLTEQQQNAMRQMHEQRSEQHLAMRKEMRDINKQLREMSTSETLDRAKAEQLSRRLGELTEQMALDRVIAKQGFYSSLTEDQRDELEDLHEERAERFEKWHGHDGRGRDDDGPRCRD